MSRIFGYGEDAFTLWALRHRKSEFLKEFQDKTSPSDCLVFYRPSFGRSGEKISAQFGEFDAILISSENIYLIESKWDNFSRNRNDAITLEPCQELRHPILLWYILHWDEKYSKNWGSFVKEKRENFKKEFTGRRLAPTGSLLATNLEFILTATQKHFGRVPSKQNVKNVLLFFYDKDKSTPPANLPKGFSLVAIDYSKEITGNFIYLDNLAD